MLGVIVTLENARTPSGESGKGARPVHAGPEKCGTVPEYGAPVAFWRSDSGYEVDFILGNHTAVEAKAKRNVSDRDLRSLRALAEENKLKRYLCVSLEPRRRKTGNITVIPFMEFLGELWGGRYR
jgi:hypothetical protein